MIAATLASRTCAGHRKTWFLPACGSNDIDHLELPSTVGALAEKAGHPGDFHAALIVIKSVSQRQGTMQFVHGNQGTQPTGAIAGRAMYAT